MCAGLHDNSNSQRMFIQSYLKQQYKFKKIKMVVDLFNKTVLAKYKMIKKYLIRLNIK